MILGITGGSGCGKTTALKAVRDLGGLVLDCDAIYHDLLSRSPSLLAAIDRRFPGVVSQSGLDRKKLGRLVFSDAEALQDLNRIAHGAVKAQVLARLTAHPPPLAAIDALSIHRCCHRPLGGPNHPAHEPGGHLPGLRRSPAPGSARRQLLSTPLRLHPGKQWRQGCILPNRQDADSAAPGLRARLQGRV